MHQILSRALWRGLALLALVAQLVLAAIPASAASAIIYVDADALGANNGSSWANAYTSLQRALGSAGPLAEIWVAEGTYRPAPPNSDQSSSFVLVSNVAIYGGFNGTETDRAQRDVAGNVTILSGDLNRNDTIGVANATVDNSYHVVFSSETTNVTLDGVTISGGNANGPSETAITGGGLYSLSSTLAIANVTFSGNYGRVGGGMYSLSGRPTLTSVTFSNNRGVVGGGLYTSRDIARLSGVTFANNGAEESGGAIFSASNTMYLNNLTFRSNSARDTGGAIASDKDGVELQNSTFRDNRAKVGGGMYVSRGSDLRLADLTFTANEVTQHGGGMAITGADSLTLMSATFTNNRATDKGGALYIASSAPSLSKIIFSANQAGAAGGALYATGSSPSLATVIFINNQTGDTGNGGAMYTTGGSNASLTDVQFTTNRAQFGGGMQNVSSSPSLTRVSFTGNVATVHGGGLANDTGNPTLTDTTFSGNQADINGGGFWTAIGNPTMARVTFRDNRAGTNGGGLFTFAGSPALRNAVFVDNAAAGSGGAIAAASGGTSRLTNATLINNQADTGGAIATTDSNLSVLNSIIWGNVAFTANNVVTSGSGGVGFRSSLVQGSGGSGAWASGFGSDGGGNIDTDPLFANPDMNDLRLRPSSPALNSASGTGAPTTDVRGISRPQGTGVDMGAYEMRPFTLTVTDGTNMSAQINTDFPRPLVVTAAEQGGDPLPNVRVVWGVSLPTRAGATLRAASSDTDANGQARVTARANGIPGSYTVPAALSDGTGVSFNLSNVQESQTISFDPLPNRTYGDAAFSLTASASSGLTVTFSSATPTVCSVSGSTVTLLSAGECTIAADQAGDGTYATASTVTQGFTVARAALTITAEDATRTVGQADPAFSVTYSGWVNSETEAVLQGTLAIATTATVSSPAGSYPIVPSGVTSANYAITFANGTLTIRASEPSPQGQLYVYLPLLQR